MIEVSVVIPILNEEELLNNRCPILRNEFNRLFGVDNWAVIFVDNGSVDRSSSVIKEFLRDNPTSKVVYERFPNYGQALKRGLSNVTTEYAYILDIDQFDTQFIAYCWNNRLNYDIFIGSKRLNPSLCSEPKYREILTWGLNCIISLFFKYPGTETHGPKLLNYRNIHQQILSTVSTRGQFDTEFVLRSFFEGKRIVEVPIIYENVRKPRNFMLKKIVRNIYGICKLVLILDKKSRTGELHFESISRKRVISGTSIVDE